MADIKSGKDIKDKLMLALRKSSKGLAVAIDKEVRATTPVRTGRLKANWRVGLNRPATTPIFPGTGKTGRYKRPNDEDPRNKLDPIKQRYVDLFISNATPYASKRNIEGGEGGKPPSYWVEKATRLAVKNFRSSS